SSRKREIPCSSGSVASVVAITPADRLTGASSRPADGVPSVPLPLPPGGPPAAPDERRRGRVPMPGHGPEAVDYLIRVGRVLSVQRPPLEHPLDALGHVQPRPAQRGEQRHHPV